MTAKKKLTARQRGYSPRAEVAAELRQIADGVEGLNPQFPHSKTRPLAKYNLQIWYANEDEPEAADQENP